MWHHGGARRRRTTIIAVDVKPSLEVAQELGATHVINAVETDPVQEISELRKVG